MVYEGTKWARSTMHKESWVPTISNHGGKLGLSIAFFSSGSICLFWKCNIHLFKGRVPYLGIVVYEFITLD